MNTKAACVVACLTSAGAALLAPPAFAQTAAAPPLTFGIYPGGQAGMVGTAAARPDKPPRPPKPPKPAPEQPPAPVRPPAPAKPNLRLLALERLRGGTRPFVLHIYDEFRTRADAASLPRSLRREIAEYSEAGFQVEVVLRYRPTLLLGDVLGYLQYVRARVHQLGAYPAVTGLQVTNEVNVKHAPEAADGAYPGASPALVAGVITAKRETVAAGLGHLRIGFNWANRRSRTEPAFWRSLRRLANVHGPGTLRRSVDWVGLDFYPGTWGPLPPGQTFYSRVRKATVAALRRLRGRYLPLAGLRRVPLHLSEAGYPTGPTRTESMQMTVLQAMVRTVARRRAEFGVTDLRWFNLRDTDSSARSFERRYGLLRDDYTPKLSFTAYKQIVAGG